MFFSNHRCLWKTWLTRQIPHITPSCSGGTSSSSQTNPVQWLCWGKSTVTSFPLAEKCITVPTLECDTEPHLYRGVWTQALTLTWNANVLKDEELSAQKLSLSDPFITPQQLPFKLSWWFATIRNELGIGLGSSGKTLLWSNFQQIT